jgi:hypothetical protein
MKRLSLLLAAVGAVAVMVAGCGGGGSGSNGSGSTGAVPAAEMSKVSFSLVDTPFRFSGQQVTAVTITVKRIELVGTGGKQTVATLSPPEAINLLDFQKPPGIQLGTGSIPAGNYEQARLILDSSQPDNNSVTLADGTVEPLKIPSATNGSKFGGTSVDNGNGPGESGVKVKIGLNAVGGQTYSILLDFNAAESIVTAGHSGKWIMKPVIVGSAYASGWIAGVAVLTQPSASPLPIAGAEIVAVQNGQMINTGVTGTDGSYSIDALPQGNYSLTINNQWMNQAGQVQPPATPSNGVPTGSCAGPFDVTTGQTSVNIAENPTPAPSASPGAAPFVCATP